MDTPIVPPLKRCTKCGVEYPATAENFFRQKAGKFGFNAQCKKCIAIYKESTKEQRRDYNVEWNKNNLEKNRERQRRFREKHPERVKEAELKRYRSDPEKEKQRVRDYRKKNPDKVRARYKAYKSTPHGRRVVNHHASKYRSRKMSVQHDFTLTEWDFCLSFFNHSCAVCGQRNGFWAHVVQDHWIPVKAGGATIAENIIPLCHGKKDGSNCCNNTKSDRDADEWLIWRVGKKKAAQIKRKIEEYFKIVRERKNTSH